MRTGRGVCKRGGDRNRTRQQDRKEIPSSRSWFVGILVPEATEGVRPAGSRNELLNQNDATVKNYLIIEKTLRIQSSPWYNHPVSIILDSNSTNKSIYFWDSELQIAPMEIRGWDGGIGDNAISFFNSYGKENVHIGTDKIFLYGRVFIYPDEGENQVLYTPLISAMGYHQLRIGEELKNASILIKTEAGDIIVQGMDTTFNQHIAVEDDRDFTVKKGITTDFTSGIHKFTVVKGLIVDIKDLVS